MLALAATLPTALLAPTTGRKYARAGDFAGLRSVSEAEVVSVLGRWRTHKDWDSIGALKEIDKLFDSDGNIVNGAALRGTWQRWEAQEPPKRVARILYDRSVSLYGFAVPTHGNSRHLPPRV